MTGFSPSLTKACSRCVSIGTSKPAMAVSVLVLPATARPTFGARISPRVVRTPWMAPPSMIMPVTSQCSMMSTPRASAAWAKPQATASCRAVPPRRCSSPPITG